jgi:hypothetical protein
VRLLNVDSDGIVDALLSSQTGSLVSFAGGLGNGTFAAPTTFGVGSGPAQLAIGDFNGDAKADVVSANAIDNSITVLLNATCP